MSKRQKTEMFLYLSKKAVEARAEEGNLYEDDATAFVEIKLVRKADDGTVRNMTASPYEDLTVYGYVRRRRDGSLHISGFELSYRSPFSVNLHKAQEMVKLLRTAKRRMDAQPIKPRTAGQFAVQAATALGLKGLAIPVTDYGWSYSENSYRFEPLPRVQEEVDFAVERALSHVTRVPFTEEEMAKRLS